MHSNRLLLFAKYLSRQLIKSFTCAKLGCSGMFAPQLLPLADSTIQKGMCKG